MDTKVFAAELARSLAQRGVSREEAVKQAVSLVKTFDEDDLKEIASYTSPDDFSELSDRLAAFVNEKSSPLSVEEDEDEDVKIAIPKTPAPAPAVTVPEVRVEELCQKTVTVPVVQKTEVAADNSKTRVIQLKGEGEEPQTDGQQTRTFGVQRPERPEGEDALGGDTCVNIPVAVQRDEDYNGEVYLEETEPDLEEEKKVVLTSRGRAFFISITAVTSPLIIIGALSVLALFALGILTIAALIAVSFLLVCGEAVAGSLSCLVGIIYGGICMVGGGVGEGLFEMGLGISLGALALALGILTYNLATVALPYVFRQLLSFEGYCFKRVKPMINRFREECNRL